MIRFFGRCLALGLVFAALSGCGTNGQAIKPDASGYLATTGNGQAERAQTDVAEKIDLKEFKPLALVTGSDFIIQQVRYLGYFDQVMDLPELQRRIVEKNLQDKVPSMSDRIGINNAARYYAKFLWIHFDVEKRDGRTFIKLVATDPTSLKDLFVAERKFTVQPYVGSDQTLWYPLFNSFIDWLKGR